MAKLSLILDTRSSSELGSVVLIRINHCGTMANINTGVRVQPKLFDKKNLYSPIGRTVGREVMNEQIAKFVRRCEETIYNLKMSGALDRCKAVDIRSIALGENKARTSFMEQFDLFGRSRNSKKSISGYAYAKRVFLEFLSDNRINTDPRYDEITAGLITRFNEWMVKTNRSANTRYNIMQSLRAVYRSAIKEKYVSRSEFPFDDVDMPTRRMKGDRVKTLSVDQMREFFTADFSRYQGCDGMTRARDIAMISFFLCGANLLDLSVMEKDDGENVSYVRNKIARFDPMPIVIHIEPQLRVLIDKYSGKELLLNLMERSGSYETMQRRVRERLERISNILGFEVSMAIIRHTWATIAINNAHVQEFVVSKSLGHVDENVTERHYIDYDWNLTAEANKKVIALICG